MQNTDDPSAFCILNSAFGTRLYKTGDLARRLPNGDLEYLGRIDHQVKLRGFRIELGEIEAVLRQHPGVRDGVVSVQTMGSKPRLVAYVVQGSGVRGQGSGDRVQEALIPDPRPLTPDLRAFLQAQMPHYMMPSTFVLLEALPLTPNGKVDRRALSALDQAAHTLVRPFMAPRTPLEQTLAEIWADVLGLERVGIHDNFFELGGHSLLATQIMSRVNSELQITLPLRIFFEMLTIAHLARHIEMTRWRIHKTQADSDVATDGYEEGRL